MKDDEKRQFINSLCNDVRDDVLGRVSYMPEEWDGIELRQYVIDAMERGAGDYLRHKENRKRYRSYRSAVGTKFGL